MLACLSRNAVRRKGSCSPERYYVALSVTRNIHNSSPPLLSLGSVPYTDTRESRSVRPAHNAIANSDVAYEVVNTSTNYERTASAREYIYELLIDNFSPLALCSHDGSVQVAKALWIAERKTSLGAATGDGLTCTRAEQSRETLGGGIPREMLAAA